MQVNFVFKNTPAIVVVNHEFLVMISLELCNIKNRPYKFTNYVKLPECILPVVIAFFRLKLKEIDFQPLEERFI